MYFNDLSCNPQNTFRKMESLQILKMIPIEWMALISVSHKKLAVDGEINYNQINSQAIIARLTSDKEKLFLTETASLWDCQIDNGNCSTMIIPIRSQSHYKVFFVCAYPSGSYSHAHLATMDLVMTLLYENILLRNQNFQGENYLANILDSSESVIISTDPNGQVTTANRIAQKLLGTKSIVGKPLSSLLPNETGHNLYEMITQVAFSNKNIRYNNILLKTRSGRNRVMNISINPLYDSKKNIVGVLFIATDVTKRRIMERQIEQLNQFAVLGEIAAGVAHDIRNPLMSIRGCSKILIRELSHQPHYLEFLEPIIQETNRINEVIEQMIAYGRIAEETNYSLININEVLSEAINVAHFHKNSKTISLQKDLADNIPLMRGKNVELKQAFINILINSLQAINGDGIISVRSLYDENKKEIQVSITDNGVGIEQAEMKNIFRPFYSTKHPTGGLGLSIVNRVIKEHQGKIVINSKVAVGTIFEVLFPCRQEV